MPIRQSLVINGRKKAFSLEKEFWIGLQRIARSKGITPTILVEQIVKRSGLKNLAATLRIYVFKELRSSQRPPVSRRLRARAKEYRLLATRAKDQKSRSAFLAIAYDYERIAARADRS